MFLGLNKNCYQPVILKSKDIYYKSHILTHNEIQQCVGWFRTFQNQVLKVIFI